METESKYLKKIRDEIEKKSGKTVTHEGPNTVPNYLNDISKAVKNLDIGGGGGIIEGPFSFTNETKRGTGNKTTDTVEISNEVIDYKSVTTNSDNIDIKELKINPASADNSYPNVEIKAKIDNADIPDITYETTVNALGLLTSQEGVNGDRRDLMCHFDRLAIGSYDASTDKGTVMDVRPDDIVMTGTAGNTWDGTHDSLKEALAMIPAVMQIMAVSQPVTIEAGSSGYFFIPINPTQLKNVSDICSWTILCGYKPEGSDTIEYRTLPVKNDFVKFTQSPDGASVAHSMEFDLENYTESDMTFDEILVTLLYRRES